MKYALLTGVALSAFILAATQSSAADYAPPSGTSYKPYVSLFGGAALLTKNPHGTYSSLFTSGSVDLLMKNPGYIIGGAVGVDWGNHIRTELELSHARWTADKVFFSNNFSSGTAAHTADASATYLLGNAWLDLNEGSRITPYVGGGLGVGWANVNAYTNSKLGGYHFNSSGLAFQLGAGFIFNVSDSLAIDVGYRFKDIVGLNYAPYTQGAYTETITDTSLASHNFQIGLTYKF
jgi:opacity protein-like surface antigen